MPSNTNPTVAPALQYAYQPPAYVFLLEYQGISLHGEVLDREIDGRIAVAVWKNEVLKPFKKKPASGPIQREKPLSFDQIAALRATRVKKEEEAEKARWMVAANPPVSQKR
jgi:hypothetical protein